MTVVHFTPGKWREPVACGRRDAIVSSKQAHVVSCEGCRRTADFEMASGVQSPTDKM